MRKKILIIGLVVLLIVVVTILTIPNESNSDIKSIKKNNVTDLATVIMPTKSSRPGCEETNSCYIPSQIFIHKGESVTWLNEDAAFHSVTSGKYENPDGMFDSKHLDPNEFFTIKFDEYGTFDYFCTLHPWMHGQVIVR
ncbi:MAG TPA: plastocyanin/azurin family copper-binding protein [Nitrosopumilaceae archaeon]|nr:plastocyanin/azurin family copper-binding protein [Nitrosopumilaceae archaeon]